MHSTDAPALYDILDELCAAFDKPKLDTAGRIAFWTALSDASIHEVRGNAQRIMRTATEKTRFPKPAQLRNVVPDEGSGQRAHSDAEAQVRREEASRRSWDAYLKADPEIAAVDLRIAGLARVMIRETEGSEEWQDARRDWWRARDERDGILNRRYPSILHGGYRYALHRLDTLPYAIRTQIQERLAKAQEVAA